MNDEIAYQLLM